MGVFTRSPMNNAPRGGVSGFDDHLNIDHIVLALVEEQ
jgi:hypothetical protein